MTMISAGGTGLSWIPVPTKLFQDRGWVFGSTICACKCRMGLVSHTAAVSGITLCIREQAHQHVGLAASRGQHHCQFHQLPLAEIIKFFAVPRLWAFRRKRARGDDHNKNFSLAHQNSAVCQQHDPSSAYNSKRLSSSLQLPLSTSALLPPADSRYQNTTTTASTAPQPPPFTSHQHFQPTNNFSHHGHTNTTQPQDLLRNRSFRHWTFVTITAVQLSRWQYKRFFFPLYVSPRFTETSSNIRK